MLSETNFSTLKNKFSNLLFTGFYVKKSGPGSGTILPDPGPTWPKSSGFGFAALGVPNNMQVVKTMKSFYSIGKFSLPNFISSSSQSVVLHR